MKATYEQKEISRSVNEEKKQTWKKKNAIDLLNWKRMSSSLSNIFKLRRLQLRRKKLQALNWNEQGAARNFSTISFSTSFLEGTACGKSHLRLMNEITVTPQATHKPPSSLSYPTHCIVSSPSPTITQIYCETELTC